MAAYASEEWVNQYLLNPNAYRDFTFKTDGNLTDLTRGYLQARFHEWERQNRIATSKVFHCLYESRSKPLPDYFADKPVYQGKNQNMEFPGTRFAGKLNNRRVAP